MVNKRDLHILLAIVLLNYLAQIPYYFHQYYLRRHLPPSLIGTILLTLTLIWFLVGYLRYCNNQRFGRGILLSFLITQVLFYGHSVILGILTGGGIVAQLQTNSPFLLVIFLIGDVNFLVAAYFAWKLSGQKQNQL